MPGVERAAGKRQRVEASGHHQGAGLHASGNHSELCRAYARSRETQAGARRDLEELRAAVNHHRQEGHCDRIISVVLPDKSVPPEEWLTRSQAAKLLWAAWCYREVQKGHPTGRQSRRHLTRLILVGLYTGTRAAAICGAALEPTVGKGWVDLSRGIFYRRPAGQRETKKRRPAAPLPQRLLAHMRRWQRSGQRYVIEWNGQPVKDVDKAFRALAHAVGLRWVTPHVLRHTAATWLMQLGTPKCEAAEYLGMTPSQCLRTGPNGLRTCIDWTPELSEPSSSAAESYECRKILSSLLQI